MRNDGSERLQPPLTPANTSIRPFRDDDESAVVGVWHRSGQAAYAFLPLWQTLTLDRAGMIFREVILGQCDLWVGTLEQQVVAYLAMKGSYIDRMFVDPSQWRKGWGTRLVAFAKSLSPNGLELHTHQENHAARMLYERHGFKAVKFGTSPPPESAPDVEYHWRPDNSAVHQTGARVARSGW
jgi:putative acetyltransferase